jgi:SAM-dependent methyltransferase
MSRDIADAIRRQAPVERLQAFLDARLGDRPALEVLEAGCGSAGYFRFGRVPRLTGIDISREALAANADLHERIAGDLETYDLGAARFDVVVSWNVLEHLGRPERAVERLARALRPGGLLVLGLPNLHSVKGLATKFLPHGAHVWVYRTLHRNPNDPRSSTRRAPSASTWPIPTATTSPTSSASPAPAACSA